MHRVSLLLLVLAACPSSTPDSGTHAKFERTGGDDFYAMPFPNDIYRSSAGLDLSLFPTNSLIVDSYRMVAQSLDGFGLNASMFQRFDGPLDPTSLPDPAGSLMPSASVYVVNIDKSSPDYNTRTPVIVTFVAAAGQTIGDNRLIIRPYPGFPLDEHTTYAFVITDRVHDAAGQPIGEQPAFDDVLSGNGPAAYQPFVDWLATDGNAEAGDVVSAGVFTTQTATSIVPAIRKGVFGTTAPVGANIAKGAASNASFQEFDGTYTAPNFQAGNVPYTNPPDGEISVGADGAAVVVRMEPMRFAITIPPGATPAGGWPYVIYQHGTGGDYRSFIDDGTASRLGAQGLAVISTDQVLHGPLRNPGGNEETDFFNIGNPFAARDNALQGVADAFSQLRLANGLSFTDGARTITMDPTHVMFFGHSQGGLTGPGFVAFEPSVSGAVFSGTGGLLYLALLYKTQPVDISSLVATFLRDDPVDENNASLALAQMWVERSDGANYAPLMVRHPIDGIAPRNIFQTEGFTDTFCPNPAIEAFATALGGDLVMTAAVKPIEGVTLRGGATKAPPVSGNRDGVTAVLAQYDEAPNDDGHFVVFDVPEAATQSSQFLGTLAHTGTATVVAP